MQNYEDKNWTMIKIAVFVVIFVAFFKLWYIHEPWSNLYRLFVMQICGFILPGYLLLQTTKMNFINKLLIGTVLGYAIVVIFTIYINVIFGVQIQRVYLIPSVAMVLYGWILRLKNDV